MHQPRTVTAAALLWSIAVAAGVAETVLAVTELAMDDALHGGVWADVGIRTLIYAGAAGLVVAFTQGRRWARAALAGLLSVVGLAAMVVPAAAQLADGDAFAAAFGSGGDLSVGFLAVRLAHIGAVLAATALMFTPSANRHFAKRPAAA